MWSRFLVFHTTHPTTKTFRWCICMWIIKPVAGWLLNFSNIFLHIPSSWVKIWWYTKNHLPGTTWSGCTAMHREERKKLVLTMANYTCNKFYMGQHPGAYWPYMICSAPACNIICDHKNDISENFPNKYCIIKHRSLFVLKKINRKN